MTVWQLLSFSRLRREFLTLSVPSAGLPYFDLHSMTTLCAGAGPV